MIKLVKHISIISLFTLGLNSCFRPLEVPEITNDKLENVFEQYDFNSGEYELFGVYWSDFQRNSLADSIGNFSIKDTALLNQLKLNWNLNPNPEQKCGYDYKIYLAKGNTVVSTSFLNIRCESILMDDVSYEIEREKIAALYGKTDSIGVDRVVFYGQDIALEYVKTMRDDPNMFVLDNGGYVWEKYIGYFDVTYSNTDIKKSSDALLLVENEISKKYKTNDFQLESVGANVSNGTYKVRIFCAEEFSKGFELYPILKPYTFIINYSMTGFKRL